MHQANCGADISRSWSFNITLLITGIFGLATGGAHNFVTLASLFAVAGVGVGGNMPVDSAVFLGDIAEYHIHRSFLTSSCIEFVPASHQWLLTLMAIWWSIGQLLASLVRFPTPT